MAFQRQSKMVLMGGNNEFGDTTYTKVFVGGLAWETKRDALKFYFEKFGEILEAVVINDKISGRSKGYGFVTFKDADAATRACQNPYPIIDGRRANCNIAAFGAQKNHHHHPPPPPPPHPHGKEKLDPVPPRSPSYAMYYRQPTIPQYPFPQSSYGFHGYPSDVYAMNYYNGYGGQQQFQSGSPTVYYYPLYGQHGGPNQYPKMIQYPYLSHLQRTAGAIPYPMTATDPSLTTGSSSVAAAAGDTISPANERSSSTKPQDQSTSST